MEQISDSLAKVHGLSGGMYIKQVFPESTGETAKMTAGDILLQVNDLPTDTYTNLYLASRNLRADDQVQFTVFRNGKQKVLKGTVRPKPLETCEHAEVIYDEVPFKNGWIRTIIRKPEKAGKHPAIFLIPGYNCASYDNLPDFHPYEKILDKFSELGYVTIRTEKTGMGDNTDTPDCYASGFHTEMEGFEAGYKTLPKYDFIDQDNIFVLGHSLGGIQAPIIGSKFNPKGIIVYGTAMDPWYEYLLKMVRFQNPRFGVDRMQHEKDMRIYHHLLFEHYVLNKPLKEVAKNEEYRRLLERDFQYQGGDMLFQRHYTYWQEINDLNLAEHWKNTNSYVYSVYGEADIEALNAESQQDIVSTVNDYHPGKAEFKLLEGTSHSFLKVGTMEDVAKLKREGKINRAFMDTHFNYEFVDLCHQWIQDKLGKKL